MKLQYKGLYTRASLILMLAYAATYLSFHMANVIFTTKDLFSYVWYFTQKATFLLLPLVSALLALIADVYLGTGKALARIIPMSLAKFIYSLPYYYVIFVNDIYDSFEALIFALIQTTAEIVFLYVFTVILFLLLKWFLSAFNKKGEPKTELIAKKTELNFSDPVCRTFALSSLLCFLYFFVVEVIDTVAIVSRYSGRLTGGEIGYIVFSYCFDVLLLAAHYFVLSYIKNYIAKYRVRKANEK